MDEKLLNRLGNDCGREFGNVVVNRLPGRLDDLNRLIGEWFRYDSNAGFGRFEQVDQFVAGHDNKERRIVLHYNFLTSGDQYRRPDASLCAFMRGYIRGVFANLPPHTLQRYHLHPDTITVCHDPASLDCICASKDEEKGCTFIVMCK